MKLDLLIRVRELAELVKERSNGWGRELDAHCRDKEGSGPR